MQIPKEEVRQAILSAAEEEILQTGYRSCSIRSIAARAGISPGNIYAYFSGKEEILDCILRPALGGIHGVMESPFPEGSPGEMVRQVTGRLAEVFPAVQAALPDPRGPGGRDPLRTGQGTAGAGDRGQGL